MLEAGEVGGGEEGEAPDHHRLQQQQQQQESFVEGIAQVKEMAGMIAGYYAAAMAMSKR